MTEEKEEDQVIDEEERIISLHAVIGLTKYTPQWELKAQREYHSKFL